MIYDCDDNDDANDAFFENSLEEKWRKMCPQNEKNSLTKTLNLTLWLTF